MLKIGITGGIGSGKSTVSKIFASLGVPAYIADKEAKKLLNENDEVKNAVKAAFGKDIYTEDGVLLRSKLAGIIFSDDDKLRQLESIVHPAVKKDFENWGHAIHKTPYLIKEAALLYESGSYMQLDKIIVVTAPVELRIKRVMARDNVEREKVLDRLEKQLSEGEKVRRADYIIYNDERRMIIPQVMQLHQELTMLAGH